ncbi:MAG TPA: sugar transferase [bacterium]|nr:sugar transferase [bacterium]HOL93243.1 sugar transferase [bacterium]HPP00934.1 sugar transferase [bacterium]
MPRWLEFILALLALFLVSPLFLVLMLAIVLDSPGWPLFFQRRVGINGQYFWMIKFRKMPSYVPPDGKGITTRNDVRLTRVGRFLERFKLDELPQLINVLLGHMALIGPRPEIPKFTAFYPEQWKIVLSVRPGIIGFSQIKHPHETDLYPPGCVDHEKYYVEHILPAKLKEEIEYVGKKSWLLDLKIFGAVTIALLTKTITVRWLMVHLTHAFMLLSDTLVSVFSLVLAFHLVFQMGLPSAIYPSLKKVLLLSLMIRPAVFFLFGLHRYPISSAITAGYLLTIIKASFYSSLALTTVLMFFEERDLYLSAHITDALLLPAFLTAVRIGYIAIHDSFLASGFFRSLGGALTHLVILALYGMMGFFSFWISHMIRMHQLNIALLIPKLWAVSLAVVAIRTGLALFLWPPRAKTWRSFFGRELFRIAHVSLIGMGLILLVYLFLQDPNYSRLSIFMDTVIFSVLASIVALLWCLPQMSTPSQPAPRRVILLGVGIEAELLLSTLERIDSDAWKILGIVTDIEWKRYSSISGFKIIGTVPDLESLFEVYHPDLIITWEWMTQSDDFPFIQKLCEKHGVDITVSPTVSTLMASGRNLYAPPEKTQD